MHARGSGVRLYDGPDLKLYVFILAGWDWVSFVCCLVHLGLIDDLLLLQISSGVVWQGQRSPTVTQHVVSVESSSLLFHSIKT